MGRQSLNKMDVSESESVRKDDVRMYGEKKVSNSQLKDKKQSEPVNGPASVQTWCRPMC